MRKNIHVGSSLDKFLEEEGILEEVCRKAKARVEKELKQEKKKSKPG